MLTIEQCRGARGVLGWTQQDLADASGLSKTAINNFEKGHSDIKAESLRAIRMAFESADIEFIERDGLRRRSENVMILKGPDAIDQLFEDIRDAVRAGGDGEILIANIDSRFTGRISPQALLEHLETLRKCKVRQRILCAPGESNILGPADECRWLPKERMSASFATFIYGDKVAFELWDRSMIVVIGSTDARQAERERFEYLWNHARAADKQPGSLKGGVI